MAFTYDVTTDRGVKIFLFLVCNLEWQDLHSVTKLAGAELVLELSL